MKARILEYVEWAGTRVELAAGRDVLERDV